ncbi:MAG: glycosyltransferase family 39 protein [Candidatus Wallbacteria bacterium]|nr:glycosyltransferase family 39 protein [Candidatus Wallbacteria bacterium]
MKPKKTPKARPPGLLASLRLTHPAALAIALTLLAALYRLYVWNQLGSGTVEGMVKGVPFSDSELWHDLATQFAQGELVNDGWKGGWSARRPFFYLFMGSFYSLFGCRLVVLRCVQFLLGAASAGLIFDAARRLAPIPVALAAALLHAFLGYDSQAFLTPLSEPLGYFLANLSLWIFVVAAQQMWSHPSPGSDLPRPMRAILFSGALLGLANLTRPLNLLCVGTLPFVLGALIKSHLPAAFSWRRLGMATLALAGGVALTLFPWMLRQRLVHGIWTLSENTAEVMFAASSPEFGVWTPAAGAAVSADTIEQRVRAYNASVAKNLRERPGFYAANVAKHTWHATEDVARHRAWLAAAAVLVVCWLAASAGPVSPGPWLWPTAMGLLTAVALLPQGALCLFWLAGSALALWSLDAILILPAVLVPSVATLGSMAMSGDPRLTHSLEWLSLATATWLFWQLLARARDGRFPKPEWHDASGYACRSWGAAALPVRRTAAAFGLLLALGLAKASLANLYPKPASALPVVEQKESAEWIERVLRSEAGSTFEPLRSKLVVRRGPLRNESSMAFAAGEEIGSWYGLFRARPYAFTIFETRPNIPETRVVYPGALDDLEVGEDLVLVGVPAPHPVRGNSLELIGLGRPSKANTLLVPEPQAARIHAAYIDAVLSSAQQSRR